MAFLVFTVVAIVQNINDCRENREEIMELLTKEMSRKLTKQFKSYSQNSDFKEMVIAKLFDPGSGWEWFIVNRNPRNLDELWGITNGIKVTKGGISLSKLKAIRSVGGGEVKRDFYFSPIPAQEVWERLKRGENI